MALTKEKAMYQTWLIIEGLSTEERNLISQDILDEIQNTMEVDPSITIDFDIPLEKQKLDSKTWKMLDRVLKSAKQNGYDSSKATKEDDDIIVIEDTTKEAVSNNKETEMYKIRLEAVTAELEKFKTDAKDLMKSYQDALKKANDENAELKKNCSDLISAINKVPKFLRGIFFKDEVVGKLLNAPKN